MSNQLIPPPELAPPSVMHLPMGKRVELWAELNATADAFLRAGLKRRVGSTGDLRAAYRAWNAQQIADHDAQQICFLTNLTRREAGRGN
jgi:hypothetical protein